MTSQSVGIPSPSSPGRGNLCCFSEKEWLDFRLQSLEVVVPPKVKSASKDACSVRNSTAPRFTQNERVQMGMGQVTWYSWHWMMSRWSSVNLCWAPKNDQNLHFCGQVDNIPGRIFGQYHLFAVWNLGISGYPIKNMAVFKGKIRSD